MPEHVSKSGMVHWYITHYDGPWQVCSSTNTMQGKYPIGFWYIVNIKTDATRLIGPVKLKGNNWYARACETAEELNKVWRDEHTLQPLERMADWSMRKIHRVFRNCDDSSKWPINGKFNATERAIRRLAKQRAGHEMVIDGYEYAMILDHEITMIVNDPKIM